MSFLYYDAQIHELWRNTAVRGVTVITETYSFPVMYFGERWSNEARFGGSLRRSRRFCILCVMASIVFARFRRTIYANKVIPCSENCKCRRSISCQQFFFQRSAGLLTDGYLSGLLAGAFAVSCCLVATGCLFGQQDCSPIFRPFFWFASRLGTGQRIVSTSEISKIFSGCIYVPVL